MNRLLTVPKRTLSRDGAALARTAGLLAIALVVSLVCVGQSAVATPQRRSAYAITGATVVTSPGNVVENATVVLRNGLVEAVGTGVSAPADARVIDASGMTVYAGWIDSFAEVAIAPDPPAQGAAPQAATRGGGGRGRRGGGQQQAMQDLELGAPGVNARVRSFYDMSEHLDGEDDDINELRDAGFTAALVIPQDGIYRGKSVLIALRQTDPEDMIIGRDVTQAIGFSTGGFGRGYPSAAMGVVSLIRQVLLDTQRAATWESSFARDPAGIPRPESNEALAALQPVLAGDQQVIWDATNTRMAKRAINISSEFGIQTIIKGNGNEYEMAGELAAAGFAVIVPVDYPDRPAVGEDDEEDAAIGLETLQRWADAPGNAAALEAAGVTFVFTSDGVSPEDFAANVRKAIDAGLSPDTALAAVTTNPARLLGVEAILGTIEPGKIANIVVASGAPFAEDTEVRHVFVDGVHTEVEAAPEGEPGGSPAEARSVNHGGQQ